jgi:excisionase family DNA binding protein
MTMLVTAAEAARRLGVSRERVRQLLEGGRMAGFRIEGRSRARYVNLSGEGGEYELVLVSIQEAARSAGVSTATIRAWIEIGHLDAFRLEGSRRVYVALD